MKESDPTRLRRFMLNRSEDECHVSGRGLVAEGVQFSCGRCVIVWLSTTPSVDVYDSIKDVEKVHGHGGKTIIEWIDKDNE